MKKHVFPVNIYVLSGNFTNTFAVCVKQTILRLKNNINYAFNYNCVSQSNKKNTRNLIMINFFSIWLKLNENNPSLKKGNKGYLMLERQKTKFYFMKSI